MNNTNLEDLKADMDKALATASNTLHLEAIDTSSWTEFGAFFKAPASKNINYEWNSFAHPSAPLGIRRLSPCAFISCVADTREKAIEALRADLLKLRNAAHVEVRAFLALPATINLATPIIDGEVADTTVTVDLRFNQPAKKRVAAFCFVHGGAVVDRYTEDFNAVAFRHLDQVFLRELGLKYATIEGEVGKRVVD